MAGGSVAYVGLVLPHQTSPLALAHSQERLGVPDGRMVDILETRGNQVERASRLRYTTLQRQSVFKEGKQPFCWAAWALPRRCSGEDLAKQ